jgi:hypothetical protein
VGAQGLELDPLIKRHHETAAIANDFSRLSAIGA